MAKTNFENLKSTLKAHPEAQPIISHRRGATSNDAAPESFTHQPALDRHRRKCQICHHPSRREIETDFLHWRSSAEIAKEFGIADHSAICRHARATGLRDERQRRIAYALHPILEQGEDISFKTTANAIVSAVRTYAQINDEGRRLRTKPVTNIYITNESAPGAAFASPDLQSNVQYVPSLKGLSKLVSKSVFSDAAQDEVSRHSTPARDSAGVDVSRHSPLATRHCLSNRPIQELEDDSTH
jgi:hypothetical protein